MDGDNAPKYRLEHSVTNKAGCQQVACKRAGVKIAKGELRWGTNVFFEPDQKYIIQWRHWGCVTPQQLRAVKQLVSDKVEDIPGYGRISTESQEQVRQAFEEGRVPDKDFKDVREDLAKFAPRTYGEITNAVGYKVDIASRAAGCRNSACKDKGVKIAKGELRLGIATPFDDDHEIWVYTHWGCISRFDLTAAQKCLEEECLGGFEALPEEYKAAVVDAFKSGEAVQPSKQQPDAAPRSTKARVTKKRKDGAGTGTGTDNDNDNDTGSLGVDAAEEEMPGLEKATGKRTARELEAQDEKEDGPTKKKRGRRTKKAAAGLDSAAD